MTKEPRDVADRSAWRHGVALVGVTVLLATALSVAPPVDAQEAAEPDPPVTTTTTTTTLPPSTPVTPPPPPEPAPDPPPPEPSVPGPPELGDAPDPDDPFHDELVEREGGYANQPAFDPGSNSVLDAELVRAQRRLAEAEVAATRSLEAVAAARARREAAQARLSGVGTEDQRLLRESEAAYQLFVDRVVDAYVRGNDHDLVVFLGAEDATEYATKSVLLRSVLEADEAVFARYLASRAALSGEMLDLHDEYAAATRELKRARVAEKEARAEVVAAAFEVRVWEAGSHVMTNGFRFPVEGEVSFGDSWGAPRMTGTSYEHWHEGTDIMAPAGTPLVACEDGVISRTSNSTLGGISLYIVGQSGAQYYYAHLSAYAPGVAAGMPVRAGDVVGYVGDTGNARGGAPHLHFEIRTPEGHKVNPYPILRVAHETQAVFAAISQPGTG